jgi:hypothetical protein
MLTQNKNAILLCNIDGNYAKILYNFQCGELLYWVSIHILG